MQTNTEAEQLPFPCKQCDRFFKSPQARNMHKVRTHGKGWDTSANFRKGGISLKEKRREYQRKLRERYKLEGRDSRGYMRRTVKGGYHWTDEQRANFQRTINRKRVAKKRIQYVYPLEPREASLTAVEIPETSRVHAKLHHCPNCGEDLTTWKKE